MGGYGLILDFLDATPPSRVVVVVVDWVGERERKETAAQGTHHRHHVMCGSLPRRNVLILERKTRNVVEASLSLSFLDPCTVGGPSCTHTDTHALAPKKGKKINQPTGA